jgi:PilZ domain-containing protein
MVNPFHLHI